MECKRNKWDCEERGGGGHFQRRKVRVACLDGDEVGREWRGIMVLHKWHHSWSSGDDRAKEGVAILLNDVCHIAVVDFGCVSSKILWIKFQFSSVKIWR